MGRTWYRILALKNIVNVLQHFLILSLQIGVAFRGTPDYYNNCSLSMDLITLWGIKLHTQANAYAGFIHTLMIIGENIWE